MKIKFIIIFFLGILSALLLLNSSLAEEPDEVYLPQFVSTGQGVISLPLEASSFTGEATTAVPIGLMPAAGDIQDKIKLEICYRSGGGNSWAGKGWELEIGYIARINKFGANNSNNPYLLVLNGQSQELVNTGGSQYRTKIESNMRIEYSGSIWQVWDRDGTLYKFENSAGGKWVLTKVTDTHGISIVIDYDRPNNEEIYLKEIRYPGGSGLSPYCKVSFISEDRADKFITYYYGSTFKIKRRLKEIQILAGGYTQKKYVLSYTTNNTSLTSLLSSVTEYGRDNQALPPTYFYYQQPLQKNILESNGSWQNDGFAYISSSSLDLNMAIVDLNGDNLPDLLTCKHIPSTPKADWIVHLNTGSSFSTQEYKWLDLENSYISYNDGMTTITQIISFTRNATLADMNKDGLPDLVYSKLAGWSTGGHGIFDIVVRYNTGNKFSDTETKILDCNQAYYTYDDVFHLIKICYSAILADMNGDGLPDLVYNKQRGWGNSGNFSISDWTVRLNTGNGFSNEEKTWLSYDKAFFKYTLDALERLERIGINSNTTLVDMNNDGLLDLVFNDYAHTETKENFASAASYNLKVRYNNGSSFSDEAVTYYSNTPVYFYMNGFLHTTATVKIGYNGTLADINGDGLADLIFNQYESGDPHAKVLWVVCFNLGDRFAEPVSLLDSLGHYLTNNTRYVYVKTRNSYFLDLNKDGITDFAYPKFTDSLTKFDLTVYLNKGLCSTDLLTRHIVPFGGSTDIAYEPSGKFDNTGSDDKNDLPFIMPLVKSITKTPGVGESGTTNYNYQDGWYDIPNREFRGFRYVQTTDPLNYVTHTYYHQDSPRLGKIERTENSITRTLYTYKQDNTAPYFTPPTQADEYTDSKHKQAAYEYDDYGNVIKAINYGDIDTSGDERSVLTDYAINSSSWLVNLPSRERLFANTDGGGTAASETQYLYDNNSNYTDTPAKGDLTKLKRYLNTKNDYIQTSSTYDSYGNELTKTDGRGYTTTIGYDSTYYNFPVSITNPKGHTENLSYYTPSEAKGLFGQLKCKTDANGNQVSFEYDGFGRKTKITGPYDTSSTYGSESYEYGLNGPGANYVLTRTTEESGTSNHLIKINILDGFERVIQTASESENQGIYAYINTIYNQRGEIARVSLPYFKDGGLRTSYLAADDSVKWMQNSYDAIGRITSITKPDTGVINYSYSGWTTTITDENNHPKIIVNDAYGRLINVKEKKADEEYVTNYSYDALDNLKLIADHPGNKFEFSYDSLKRRTGMTDPDLGTWAYDYDNNGNLIKTTDANGKVINFAYDELDRIISKDYAAQLGTEIAYFYDKNTSTNPIGRRTGMTDLSGSARWNYDKEGRIIKLQKTIDTNTYTLEWAYDAMDRVKSIIFPNLKSVYFAYNNAGLTESIAGFVLNTDYNASNQPTQIIFSNPLTTALDYYPQNQRLKSLITGSLQNIVYDYDKVGNITKITDGVHALNKEYGYDELDRLISGDGNTYEYNAIGNIVTKNSTAQQYSLSRPHALISDGINNYSYDSCGNMLSGAGRSISYDVENRPIRITRNGITTQFVYDGDGRRVKKAVINGSVTTTTVYIEGLYEKETTK